MFDFTFQDEKLLREFVDKRFADQRAVYDFTFEGRFIIYYDPIKKNFHYIVLDMTMGYGSFITSKSMKCAYRLETYRTMISRILYSIKIDAIYRIFLFLPR